MFVPLSTRHLEVNNALITVLTEHNVLCPSATKSTVLEPGEEARRRPFAIVSPRRRCYNGHNSNPTGGGNLG